MIPITAMLEGGVYKLWLYGDNQNLYAIGKAGYASSNDGMAWTLSQENPIISETTMVNLREVIKLGSTYHAYYYYDGGNLGIWHRTSSDGIHFGPADRLSTGQQYMYAGLAYQYGSANFIFSVWGDQNQVLQFATSKDGVTFSFDSRNIVFDSTPFCIESILIEDGVIKFWGEHSVGNITWGYGNEVILQGQTPELDWSTIVK